MLPKQQLPIRYFACLTRNIVNTPAQWMTTPFVVLWQPLRKGLQSLTSPPGLARVSPAKISPILFALARAVGKTRRERLSSLLRRTIERGTIVEVDAVADPRASANSIWQPPTLGGCGGLRGEIPDGAQAENPARDGSTRAG